jgi:hypothetical protein
MALILRWLWTVRPGSMMLTIFFLRWEGSFSPHALMFLVFQFALDATFIPWQIFPWMNRKRMGAASDGGDARGGGGGGGESKSVLTTYRSEKLRKMVCACLAFIFFCIFMGRGLCV